MDSQKEINKNFQALTPYDLKQKQINRYQSVAETQLCLNQANFERDQLVEAMQHMDDTSREYEKKTQELEKKKQWFINETKRLEENTRIKQEKQHKRIEQIETLKKTLTFNQNHIQKLIEEKERLLNERQFKTHKYQQILQERHERYQERKRIFESMPNWSEYRDLEKECKINQEKYVMNYL
jgi:hypothetical protein